MSTSEQVTIVITCHNKERWVGAALWSAMNQVASVGYRVLVLHDGCGGGVGSGCNAARNRALEQVRTPWAVLLDADDLMPSHYVHELWEEHRRSGSYGDRVFVGAPVQFMEGARLDMLKRPTGRGATVPARAFRTGDPAGTSCLFPLEAWRTLGGFDERLRAMTDWDMWLRMVESGYTFLTTDRTFLLRRDVPGSITNNPALRQEALRYFNEKHGTDIRDVRWPYVVPSAQACSTAARLADGVSLRVMEI